MLTTLKSIMQRRVIKRRQTQAIRELQALSNNELKDIGIARGEIVSRVRGEHQ